MHPLKNSTRVRYCTADSNSHSEPIDGQPEEEQLVDQGENEQEGSLEIEYMRPLGENGGMEAGYEGDFERLDSKYYSESLNLETGNFEPDTRLNNQFTYDEQTHAVFGILNGRLGDLTDSFTNPPGRTTSTSATPSACGARAAGSSIRSVTQDPNFRRVGNPYLNPEYTHSFEVGYTRMGNLYTLSVSPYFRHTVDEISWHEDINDDGVSILTYENFSTENSYGM